MSSNNRILYQIRRRTDGKFSRGTEMPRFTARGKVWNGAGPLKQHLGAVEKGGMYSNEGVHRWYRDCEVVAVGRVDVTGQDSTELPEPIGVLEFYAQSKAEVAK